MNELEFQPNQKTWLYDKDAIFYAWLPICVAGC